MCCYNMLVLTCSAILTDTSKNTLLMTEWIVKMGFCPPRQTVTFLNKSQDKQADNDHCGAVGWKKL